MANVVSEFRLRRCRVHDADVDSRILRFNAQGLTDSVQRKFRCTVNTAERKPSFARNRGHIDNVPSALGSHDWNYELACEKGRFEVHIENLANNIGGRIFNRPIKTKSG